MQGKIFQGQAQNSPKKIKLTLIEGIGKKWQEIKHFNDHINRQKRHMWSPENVAKCPVYNALSADNYQRSQASPG